MLVRLCLLSAFAMGGLCGPAVSADGVASTTGEARDGKTMVVAQLPRFITPRKIHMRPQAAPCPNYFSQC